MDAARRLTDIPDAQLAAFANGALYAASVPFEVLSVKRQVSRAGAVTFRLAREGDAAQWIDYHCSSTWTLANLIAGLVKHLQQAQTYRRWLIPADG